MSEFIASEISEPLRGNSIHEIGQALIAAHELREQVFDDEIFKACVDLLILLKEQDC